MYIFESAVQEKTQKLAFHSKEFNSLKRHSHDFFNVRKRIVSKEEIILAVNIFNLGKRTKFLNSKIAIHRPYFIIFGSRADQFVTRIFFKFFLFSTDNTFNCIHFIQIAWFIVSPCMGAKTALIVNRLNFRVLECMIECELIEPISYKFGPCFCCDEVIFVSEVPAGLSIIFLVVSDWFCHCISILWIVKHKYFGMLPISVVN